MARAARNNSAGASSANGAAETPAGAPGGGSGGGGWTFLTNHTHVLICIAADPEIRLRDVAGKVGITERGVQKIVHELEQAGALTHVREGRRNRYTVDASHPLHHPIEAHCTVGDIFRVVLGERAPAKEPATSAPRAARGGR